MGYREQVSFPRDQAVPAAFPLQAAGFFLLTAPLEGLFFHVIIIDADVSEPGIHNGNQLRVASVFEG